MPLWVEPELYVEHKGVRVYRQFPNRYLCCNGPELTGGYEIALRELMAKYGGTDAAAVLKAAIERGDIG